MFKNKNKNIAPQTKGETLAEFHSKLQKYLNKFIGYTFIDDHGFLTDISIINILVSNPKDTNINTDSNLKVSINTSNDHTYSCEVIIDYNSTNYHKLFSIDEIILGPRSIGFKSSRYENGFNIRRDD